jgi:predicted transcriptional regulator
MELELTPETEAKLNDLALRTHRGAGELPREAVDHLVIYNEWFEREVKASIAAVERGEIVSGKDVLTWLDRRECESSGWLTRYRT